MKQALFAVFALLFVAVPRVYADGYGTAPCTPTYGGGSNCNTITFTITKEVQSPTKGGQFVKNLNIDDPRFAPSSTINFRITVSNTGNTDISQLNLVDTFPQFLKFTSGVAGTYDANSRTLKFSMNNLKAGTSQNVVISAQAADTNSLPQNQGITCVTNTVTATETSTGAQASDSSQACIEKTTGLTTPQVFPSPKVTKTPGTGPEDLVLPLLGATGALGAFLKRKSR